MKLTYREYDMAEEVCERMMEKNENEYIGTSKYFAAHHLWPTVEQMEALQVEEHFEEYFPFLFFYYTQKFDGQIKDNVNKYTDYQGAMKYIKDIMDRNIVFVDETDDEEED